MDTTKCRSIESYKKNTSFVKLFSRSRGSINGDIVVGQPMKQNNCCAVHRGAIASMTVIKLAKRTSV